MQQEYTIEELLELRESGKYALVDVRSPKEFQEASIPGAINIPVFSNEERSEIGTLYKQESPEAAKQRGLEIFSDKLPRFINDFQKLNKPVAVFCWRGGMRSKTATTVLDLMGVKAGRLKGGIRSYRQYVVKTMESYNLKSDLIVLNGYTGTGKTKLLHQLLDKGYPVIDLEQMAGHRGSIFGQIGLLPNNQKKFDSLLLQDLEKYKDKKHIIIEGESKRIGKVVLPEFFYSKKESGTQFFLHLPIDVRVANIMEDYKPEESPEQFLEAFQFIKRNIHSPIANEIQKLLEGKQFPKAIALLLEYYYDSRYEHAITQSEGETVHIHAESMEDAFQQLRSNLKNIKF
ncbi:tRNA 2-selenouridine(34) synthase MnmH [Aciduricibacillus chroicocephali]|uniref:tRNA 2-selenouridine(34) synthase MnmH n=1 Tax=Aciduricibacillus chroicocephali TaxID=3054939 RepID=A0ABY9KXK2_9BACI|nr:tRNA 2-selenouridine(34) synthase MnmH [Bacillaceae bacterium 44XB]